MPGIVFTLLLAVHLLLVDLAMMGPLACIYLEWSGARRQDAARQAIAKRLARLTLVALAAGIVLGALLLLARYLLGSGDYFDALAAVPRDRLWFGVLELIFSLVCLSVYVGLWNACQRYRGWHRLLAVAAATNLLVHFPALFSAVSVLHTRPALAVQVLDRAAYRRLLIDPEVLSRVAHVWVAAAAVTGVALMVLVSPSSDPSQGDDSGAEPCLFRGAQLALAATLLQFPVGIWVAMAMPEHSRAQLLGGDPLAAVSFAASLLLAVVLLHLLSAVALGEASRRRVRGSVATIALVTLLMASTRVRLSELAAGSARAEAAPTTQLAVIQRSAPLETRCP